MIFSASSTIGRAPRAVAHRARRARGVAATTRQTRRQPLNSGIGYQAGVTLTAGNNNIYIGNPGAGVEFQTIRVGTAQTSTFIAGIVTARGERRDRR